MMIGYHHFTKDDVLKAVINTPDRDFLNRTAFIIQRITKIQRLGPLTHVQIARRVKRLLDNLETQDMVKRSSDVLGNYGYEWALTDIGAALCDPE